MKRIIVLSIFFFFVGYTYAQNIRQSNIPAVVLNAFQLKCPTADDVKWKLEEGNYLVYYKVNDKGNKLTMDYKGNVIKHAQDLYESEIPKAVLETIRKKAAYFDIKDADKYENGNKITYEIKFKIDGEYHFFWINKKGKLLKYRKDLKDDEIPSSMIHYLKGKYRSIDIGRAKYVEGDGYKHYIIRAKMNDRDQIFVFDTKSNLLKHIQEIQKKEIPSPIIKTIKSDYKDYDIRGVKKVQENGGATYILSIRESGKQINVTFNSNGQVLEIN